MNPNHRFLRILAAILTLSISALLIASTPARAVQYNITQITDRGVNWPNTPHYINNKGEIVWADYYDGHYKDVYLYKNGSATKIISTSSSGVVSINDNGDILYGDGGDLRLYSNGNISRINCYPAYAYSDTACINNSRQIAFIKREVKVDGQIHYSLCIYDNGTITTIFNT